MKNGDKNFKHTHACIRDESFKVKWGATLSEMHKNLGSSQPEKYFWNSPFLRSPFRSSFFPSSFPNLQRETEQVQDSLITDKSSRSSRKASTQNTWWNTTPILTLSTSLFKQETIPQTKNMWWRPHQDLSSFSVILEVFSALPFPAHWTEIGRRPILTLWSRLPCGGGRPCPTLQYSAELSVGCVSCLVHSSSTGGGGRNTSKGHHTHSHSLHIFTCVSEEDCCGAHVYLLILRVRWALILGVLPSLGLWLLLHLLLSLPAICPPLILLLVFALVVRSSFPFPFRICSGVPVKSAPHRNKCVS